MFSPAACIFLSILLCVPGQSSYKSIFMVYTERRVGISCSVYDMLHTDAKGYIIMCKLVKLAFCLCSLIKHNFAGIGIRLSLHFVTVFYCLLDSAAYGKKG